MIVRLVPPGSNFLVEYDATSQWYNACTTIAAGWLGTDGIVAYDVTVESPDDLRTRLKRLGLDVNKLEIGAKLENWDFYTATLGRKSNERFFLPSLKVADLSIWDSRVAMSRPPEPNRLELNENISVFDRFNDENSWVEWELARRIPAYKSTKNTLVEGLIRGVLSERAYRKLEAAFENVVDFKFDDTSDPPRNLMRIRSMRSLGFDGRWHRLNVNENMEVALAKGEDRLCAGGNNPKGF